MPERDVDFSQLARQPGFVDATDLVEQNATALALQFDLRPATQRLPLAGDRRHDHARQRPVHVVGRNHQGGARLPDSRSNCGIEVDSIDFAAP